MAVITTWLGSLRRRLTPTPQPADAGLPHLAKNAVYGVIEWDSSDPTLIVGPTAAAVRRAAVRLLVARPGDGVIAADDPTFNPPIPDAEAPDSVWEAWLDAFCTATTIPWFSLFDPTDDDADLVTVRSPDLTLGDGEEAQLLVGGHLVTAHTQQDEPGRVLVHLCSDALIGCGNAYLTEGMLRIALPPEWDPADKAAAACLIARIAYQTGAT
jgi:hypothetical protein